MHQIKPQETFPVVYLISDPSDTNTYYVRAVVRNSVTGAIIKINNLDYINLTVDATNSRRFSKTIQAPSDSSGQGFYIDVTATVYTDSGYTTKSEVYQEELLKYLVADRWDRAASGGGSGPVGALVDLRKKEDPINYEKLALAVIAAFKTLPKIKIPDATDLEPTNQKIESILEAHTKHSTEMGAILSTYFKNLIGCVEDVMNAVKSIKPTDLTPVIEKIGKIEIPETPDHREVIKQLAAGVSALHESLEPVKLHSRLFRAKDHGEFMKTIKEIAGDTKPKSSQPSPYDERAKRLIG